jgi:hypothetical protein
MGGGRVSRRNGKMAKGKIEIDTFINIISYFAQMFSF